MANTFYSSSPPRPEQDTHELSTEPLVVKTTAEMGFQVPLGLVVNELRTSPEQSLVIEAGADQAFLDSSSDQSYVSMRSDETDYGYNLKTDLIQTLLNEGFTEDL